MLADDASFDWFSVSNSSVRSVKWSWNERQITNIGIIVQGGLRTD